MNCDASQFKSCEICDSHSGVVKDSGLQESNAVSQVG